MSGSSKEAGREVVDKQIVGVDLAAVRSKGGRKPDHVALRGSGDNGSAPALMGELLCMLPAIGAPDVELMQLMWVSVEVTDDGCHAGVSDNQVFGQVGQNLLCELMCAWPGRPTGIAVNCGNQDPVQTHLV